MVYVVRVSCHVHLDIYLCINLNVNLDINLDIHLNIHLHLYLTLPPPHLAATPLLDLRFTTSLLSPSTQSKSTRSSFPPHLP